MGFLDVITGQGGKKAAKKAKLASRWMPPQLNAGGATSTFNIGDVKNGIPGSASSMLSPQQQSMYDRLNQFAMSSMDRLDSSANATPAVPGYPGITPELYSQFQASSNYPQQGYGSVGNIYSPNVANMGQVGKASFDASGLPQVSGVDMTGMPQVSGGVDWSGKASGLDQAYLDKSKSFLDASAPVTGFDGLAKDWYSGLRQLSQDDQNNMLAGAGDKQFLRGMLGSETGGGYNPAMKAAFSAYNDQDLKDKMAGYGVAADASQRNLNQALQAGGYVQQNDQTRLQQAIAQGQIGIQGQIANAGNWLTGQGMNMQAQQANAGNWLTGQGMNLQAQGMNQNADAQNIQNYLQGQGMLTDASGAQATRDMGVNAQTLSQNSLVGDQANQRMANAMNMFGMGQNTINAEQSRLMQMLAAGAGGASGYDQQLLQMLGLQGNLGSAQSGANLGAYGVPVQQGMNASNFWGGMFGQAANGASGVAMNSVLNSDRRLKTDIVRVGTTPHGYPWYTFNYVWGKPGEGVMSDEVPQDWVVKNELGYDMVDYAKVQ